jgi:hypothetical protein
MGVWGISAFENDDAMDWVGDLLESRDQTVLERALEAVCSDVSGYIEAPEGAVALAAAEMVASALGAPGPNLPSQVSDWMARHESCISAATVQMARQAVELVAGRSELRELWGDSDSAGWEQMTADLQKRLVAASTEALARKR